jgi:hypothetical protein
MAIVRERPFEIADPSIFPASASELHGLGRLAGPLDQLYGARAFDQLLVEEGGFGPGLGRLGACPEGASTKYTGVPVPGTNCFCSPGRVVHNGRCQSPESVAQQAGAKLSEYAAMSVAEQMAQPLSAAAKQYFQMTRHSVSCKLVYPDPVPGGPNHPTNMCSIDGGPYVHGAFAINLNPGTAITSELQRRAAEQVSASTGVAPGALYSTPELAAQLTAATKGLTQQETAAQVALQANAAGAGSGQTQPPPATSSGGGGQYEAWSDIVVPPGASAGDTVLPGVMAWSTPEGTTQYEVFGVPVPTAVTEEWISGIPNWLLIALGLGAGYVAFKK